VDGSNDMTRERVKDMVTGTGSSLEGREGKTVHVSGFEAHHGTVRKVIKKK